MADPAENEQPGRLSVWNAPDECDWMKRHLSWRWSANSPLVDYKGRSSLFRLGQMQKRPLVIVIAGGLVTIGCCCDALSGERVGAWPRQTTLSLKYSRKIPTNRSG